jgi:uncharacterized membrane protein HdeD (DUF308 family)
MIATLTEHWWTWLVRGALAIIFGVIAFFQPGATALALIWTFGIYAIADGILLIFGAIGGKTDHRIWYAIWGVVSILAGVVAFAQPALTGITLVWVIAAWAVVIGILQIIAAIQVRQEIEGEFWLILAGILSVVAGVLLFAAPGIGGISLVYLIGIYAVLLGIAFIGFAFRVKDLGERTAAARRA